MESNILKDAAAGLSISYVILETSLGNILVAATQHGVCCLSFGEDAADLASRFPNTNIQRGGDQIEIWGRAAVAAVENPSHMPDIPLDIGGTEFQRMVWRELRRIPPGETRSYAEIAAAIGKPKAVRAAGSANGANNVAVLIPCHRVIRSDGALGGYAYGQKIKKALLAREKNDGIAAA